jgi:LacI family transcriptional regulator
MKDAVDGILLAPPLSDSLSVLQLLQRNEMPTVTIGTQRIEENIPSVSIDDRRAAYEMTRHIIALGHRRIGFIVGSPEQLASELRLKGYRDAMAEAGLEVADELVVQGQFSYRSGLEAAEQLLARIPRPTAIFASNDDMAAATVATAHRHRIDVPGNLSVCGFDDTLLATTIWPEITTIRQPITDMSHAAIELLGRLIRNRRAGVVEECEHLTLAFQLVRRQSAAAPV